MSGQVLRVASFNAALLARPGVRFHEQQPYSLAEFDAKTGFIGGLIETAQADLVGFQEVFHEDALQQAVAKAPRFSGAFVTAPFADDNGPRTGDGALTAPRVGLASRLPVLRHESFRAFPAELGTSFAARRGDNGRMAPVEVAIRAFERPVLRAEVQFPDGVVAVVYVVHLKSRRPVVLEGEDRADAAVRARAVVRALVQRAAEAAALRLMLTRDMTGGEAAGRPVLVLGDLNDEVASVTTELVRGEQPLPESLRPLMDDPEAWHRKNRRLWDLHLYSAAEIQSGFMKRAALYTHIHFGDYQVLDHILISHELHAGNPRRVASLRYVHVYNDHVVDAHMSDLWRGNRTRSDHGVPVAEIVFDVPPPTRS